MLTIFLDILMCWTGTNPGGWPVSHSSVSLHIVYHIYTAAFCKLIDFNGCLCNTFLAAVSLTWHLLCVCLIAAQNVFHN